MLKLLGTSNVNQNQIVNPGHSLNIKGGILLIKGKLPMRICYTLIYNKMLAVITVLIVLLVCVATSHARVMNGDLAPEFTLESLNGQSGPVSLQSLRGSVVLLNIWASWCPSCKKEMPYFVEFHNRYMDSSFQVISINIDRKIDNAKRFLDGFKKKNGLDLPFTVLFDAQGKVADLYDPIGLPITYVIGSDGIVVKVFFGSITDSNISILTEAIQGALNH